VDREGWDRRYSEQELLCSAESNRFLVEGVTDLVPGRALDFGAGGGRDAVPLAERDWNVTAIDCLLLARAIC
jgi:2-polyprenyl-3-methyl-5-hydroxy-6-metoxy-1,4-benzoquinol methylase